MNGREHPLTLKQRTKECSSVKTNEDLFFLNLMIDSLHIVQHILVQKPVHGTGVEFREPYFDSYTPFYTFDMQLGSMLMISFYYFRNRLQQSNLHWLSSYYEPSVHLFLGRSWNSIRPLTGMDGPSTQVQWLHNSLSRSKRKSILITAVLQSPSRKNLEKIIGILLWATSLVHHVRFLLTSLYRDLYSIPVTNYSIKPTDWESFLNLLNDCDTITTHNHLRLPVGSRL